jgi:hypothetical protein
MHDLFSSSGVGEKKLSAQSNYAQVNVLDGTDLESPNSSIIQIAHSSLSGQVV